MSMKQRSTALYKSPFSKGYWRTAAGELGSTKMLVVTALLTALRIALKPLAIPIAANLSIQTATLATALGAMIFGPVVAIPAAIVSDTIGFIIYPTGDYFLPFVLTEIAGTMIYALFLYRAEVTPIRVMLARFCICFFVNVVLQQFIYAWYYLYIGNPERAANAVMDIMTTTRIIKNVVFFPVETVVLTLFLGVLLPVTQRAGLTFSKESSLRFTKKDIIVLVCLVLVGVVGATFYVKDRYETTSRSADYSDSQRVQANQEMTALVQEKSTQWDEETLVCVVDSAYRGIFESNTDYTVSVYTLDEAAFATGQATDSSYSMDTLWGYSKSGPGKDPYGSLVKVATLTCTKNEKTGEILSFELTPVEEAS